MISKRFKILILILVGIIFIGLAIFVWAVQTGKIDISANMTTPPPKVELTATAGSDTQISLSWKTTGQWIKINKIVLQTYIPNSRCVTGAKCAPETIFQTQDSSIKTWKHTGLKPNTTYYYRIIIYYGTANNNIQDEAKATTKTSPGTCAQEDQEYSPVFKDKYPEHCCAGLTEWYAGMDTRKVENGKCVETGKISGWPVGICIKCGDGICGKNENLCNCPKDCTNACKKQNELVEAWEKNYGTCCEGLNKIDACLQDDKTYGCIPGTHCNGKICSACGNGKCDEGENKCNCPKDCGGKVQNKPTPPKDVKAIEIKKNAIKLAWQGAARDEIYYYKIYTTQSPAIYIGNTINWGADKTIYFWIGVDENNEKNMDLNCGTAYKFYVTSANSAGESDPSATITVTTSACTTPSPTPTPTSTPSPTSKPSVSNLVKTGSNLIINILIALIGTAAIGYFIFRKDIWKEK